VIILSISKQFNIRLDVLSNTIYKTNIEVVQNDKNTNIFNFTLYKGSEILNLSTVTNQSITFKLSNGKVYVGKPTIVDATNGTMTYTLKTDDMSRAGVAHATVELYEGENKLTSCIFSFNIRADLNNGTGQVNTNDFPTLATLMEAGSNEATRIENENIRISQEQARVNAESIRVAQENARQAGYLAMIQTSNMIPKSPVATYDDISTTYPNPSNGWTTRVMDTGRLYRYNSSNSTWEWIDTITTSAYDVLLNEVQAAKYSEPVEETASIISIPANAAQGQVSVSLKGQTATNLIKNGDFRDGITEWSRQYVSTSLIEGGVILTKTNDNLYSYFYTTTKAPLSSGRKFYVKTRVRSLSGDHTMIGLSLYSSDGLVGIGTSEGVVRIDAPIINKWYSISGFRVAPSGYETKTARFSVTTQGGITGSSIECGNVFVVDVTSLFGADNEPTVEQCDKMFANYFEGTKSTVSASRLKSVGKNLFDGEVELGSIASSTGVPVTSSSSVRTKNFVPVKPNTTYLISNDKGYSTENAYAYDYNKNYIGAFVGDVPFTTGATTHYIKWRTRGGQWNENDLTVKFQLEIGSQATPYEPYTESTQYIIAKDDEGKIVELRSLPNGTKDEVRVNEGKLIERVIEKSLPTSGWSYRSKTNDGNFHIISKNLGFTDWKPENATTFSPDNTFAFSNPNFHTHRTNSLNPDLIANANKKAITRYYNSSTVYIIIPIAEYTQAETNEGADAYVLANLNGATLTYQLAQPIETYFPPQSITVKAGGTLYVEPAVKEQGIYSSTGIAIQNTSCPIKDMESVWKVTGDTETPVDISKVTIAGDGLSFTIMGAVAGERYRYVYLYDSSLTTLPTLRYSYPLNIAASISELNDLQSRLAAELGDMWMTLLPLADKELGMYMLTEISTPATATTEEIATKINEIINIWKG